MIIEVKIPLMSASEIETLIEHLNQVVYNHTGVLGESKISTLQAKLEKAKELLRELVRLKRIKDGVGKTLEYTECMPIAWKKSIDYLEAK